MSARAKRQAMGLRGRSAASRRQTNKRRPSRVTQLKRDVQALIGEARDTGKGLIRAARGEKTVGQVFRRAQRRSGKVVTGRLSPRKR